MSIPPVPGMKKLPKPERRGQLLQVALSIVRTEGTDALTLAVLAERAGVSKPIAYEHFGSRSGLLIALYRHIDDQHVAITLEAIARSPRVLDHVARVLSTAYMRCYKTIGPEWHAVSAALRGAQELESFQNELMDAYVAIYLQAFSALTTLSNRELRVCCVGILGAAESLSRDMLRGRIGEKTASRALESFIVGCLQPVRSQSV